jgi:hypothetical protein
MKYTDQTSKTIYIDIEVEIQDGDTYFHTWNEDNEPEHYYKLHIKKDPRLDTLHDIAITKILNYDDNFFISWKEVSETELPYNLRGYFCGEQKKGIITEEAFNNIKQEVLTKLQNKQ